MNVIETSAFSDADKRTGLGVLCLCAKVAPTLIDESGTLVNGRSVAIFPIKVLPTITKNFKSFALVSKPVSKHEPHGLPLTVTIMGVQITLDHPRADDGSITSEDVLYMYFK